MSEEQKRLIEETVENLKHLDKESLLVVKGSVEVLKARDGERWSREEGGVRRDEEKNRLGIVSRTTPVDSNNYFNYRINRCIHQRIISSMPCP